MGSGMAHVCLRCRREIDRDRRERNDRGELTHEQAVIAAIGLAIAGFISAVMWIGRKASETIPKLIEHYQSKSKLSAALKTQQPQEIVEFLPEEEEVYFKQFNEDDDDQ